MRSSRSPDRAADSAALLPRLRPATGSVLVGLVLLCAGCVMTDSSVSPDAAPGSAKDESAKANGESAKPCSPHPYTIAQAIRAYFHCLRCGPPPDEKSDKNGNGKEEKKNGDKNGDAKDKDKPESKEKKGDADKKNRPDADKQAGKNGNGTDKDKEEDKKDDDKKDDDKKDKDKDEDEVKWGSVHAQATIVGDGNWKFRSPYIGPHSFLPLLSLRESETTTVFLAGRLWEGGELVFNPEIAGGRGLSDVFGIASFPNGEIPRVGNPAPTPYFARLFFRQTFALGDEYEKVEDGPNLIAGYRPISRVTISVGKFSPEDFFDDNRYSHEPRTQFLNWSIMYNSAWDYPANTRGYNYGAVIELNQRDWALRYGVFGEPSVANGPEIDPHILDAQGQALELELRYHIGCRPGKVRLLGYLNHAHMGDYREALQEMPVDPDVTATRSYRYKYGCGTSIEQGVTDQFGVFLRAGWNDGHTESWAFTEVDRLLCFGGLLNGKCWCRPNDRVGLALSLAGLSQDHRDYLAAGGLGFILGDGRLNYGLEEVLETFYSCQLVKGIFAALDFQEVIHPGYNQDRGPVSILGVRVHLEY